MAVTAAESEGGVMAPDVEAAAAAAAAAVKEGEEEEEEEAVREEAAGLILWEAYLVYHLQDRSKSVVNG